MEIPRFKCSFCKEEWYGFPVYEGKLTIGYLKPNEELSITKLCPKCMRIQCNIQDGGIKKISDKINTLLTLQGGDKENKTISCLLELQDELFNSEHGILSRDYVDCHMSSADLMGRKILDEMHISYVEKIYQAGREIDAVIPYKDIIGKDIAIEWDGDYYHGNPRMYKIPNPMQIRNKMRDLDKEVRLKEYYLFLRFYESDIEHNPIWVKQQIWQAMYNIPQIRNDITLSTSWVNNV